MSWTKYSFTPEEIGLGVKKNFIDEAKDLFLKIPLNATHIFVVNYEDENGSHWF